MNRLTETKLDRSIRFYNEYVDHLTNEACKKLDVLKSEFNKNIYRDEIDASDREHVAGLMNSLAWPYHMAYSPQNMVGELAYQNLLAQDSANCGRLFNGYYSGQRGSFPYVRY